MIRLRTNAKVNLCLRVGHRRADGFHEIETVYQSVDLADTLEVAAHPSGLEVDMSAPPGSNAEIPTGSSNLVTGAIGALAQAVGRDPRAKVRIDKRIPIAAGLAGGSANAAGALVAASRLWGCDIGREELAQVAAAVGSDVPFCLIGGTVVGTGRGERLRTVASPPPLHLVLGISPETLSTAAVYAAFDRNGGQESGAVDLVSALGSNDIELIARALHNDLEAPAMALLPQLLGRKQRMLEAGALGAIVCGSGPTLIGLARGSEHAQEIATSLRGAFSRVEVTRSTASAIEWLP